MINEKKILEDVTAVAIEIGAMVERSKTASAETMAEGLAPIQELAFNVQAMLAGAARGVKSLEGRLELKTLNLAILNNLTEIVRLVENAIGNK